MADENWTFLGAGAFNFVFKSKDGKSVLKVEKSDVLEADAELDKAARSVRVWNEVNFGITERAALIPHGKLAVPPPNPKPIPPGVGWTAPFVEGRNSTQSEICEALVNIFNRSGRVVLDAIVPGNFKTVVRNGISQVICVDIGMSLKLQERETSLMEESMASLNVWRDLSARNYLPWFRKQLSNRSYRETILMTKALFTLQRRFPFITNADFLKKAENKDILEALAAELDNTDPVMKISPNILQKLKSIQEPSSIQQKPETEPRREMVVNVSIETTGQLEQRGLENKSMQISIPANVKEAYLTKLDQYINSRGTIDKAGNFSASLTTKIFRNEKLTAKKISFALALKQKIQEISSLEELQEEIRKTLEPSNKEILNEGRFFKSELKKTLQALHDLITKCNDEPKLSHISNGPK